MLHLWTERYPVAASRDNVILLPDKTSNVLAPAAFAFWGGATIRKQFCILALLFSAYAGAQTVTAVYNRDNHQPLQLKSLKVESTVVGPLVRTSTWLTFSNPFKSQIEAAMNFDLPIASALGGFAYYYGDEYVASRLIDKNKAWAIYAEITGRGRDPGIMDQMSSSSFHCQIFPVEPGHDLRVRLWSVSVLEPSNGGMVLPRPSVLGKPVENRNWIVKDSRGVHFQGGAYSVDLNQSVSAVSQAFVDGRVYIAGLLHNTERPNPTIEILHAYYEPLNRPGTGADVTQKFAEVVRSGEFAVRADNSIFGDPTPNIFKQLRVEYELDGKVVNKTVPEHDVVQLLQPIPPAFSDLREARWIAMDPQTFAFFGWLPRNQSTNVSVDGSHYSFLPRELDKGNDTARLWAQQVLSSKTIKARDEILAFSLKYGVPSEATALLAVPEAEMRAFKQRESERRRAELERQRGSRNWTGKKEQNWGSGGGGDPEIRLVIPGAAKAEAILPDGQILTLLSNGDIWAGNFDIPASAPEGKYLVRVLAHMPDGTTVERSWTYEVDRTPPVGQASLVAKDLLRVDSEPGLARVIAYAQNGLQVTLSEVSPGRYEGKIKSLGTITIQLTDHAGNKGLVSLGLGN